MVGTTAAPPRSVRTGALSRNLADYAPLAALRAGWLAAAPRAGALMDSQPLAEPALMEGGCRAAGFGGDLFGRLIPSPTALELGNLLSVQVREVRIWNTFFTAQVCSAIQGEGTEGMALLPDGVPFTVAALTEAVFSLTVLTNGPAIIEGRYRFIFAGGTAAVRISGRRLVVFPFIPEAPVEESLEWLSDVLEAYDGSEQRCQIRRAPRQEFAWEVVAPNGLERQRLQALLGGWQARVFGMPVWPQQRFLSAPVPAGAESIAVDSRFAEYREGGTALLWRSALQYEAVEITSLTEQSLLLARPTLADWPAGSSLVPLRQARLPDAVPLEDGITYGRYRLHWRVLDNEPLSAPPPPVTYLGYEVLTAPTRLTDEGTAPRELFWPMEVLDYGSGMVAVESRMSHARVNSPRLFMKPDQREAAWTLRRWLHGLAGQTTPFWLPSDGADLTVAAEFAADQTDIVIEAVGYARYLLGDPMYRHLCFRLPDGSVRLRKVLGATEGDGVETLSLDAALGLSGGPDTFKVSYLRLVRLAADRIELVWDGPGRGRCQLSLRGVAQ